MPYGFLSTTAALTVLQAALQAIQLNNAPMFQKVDFFDMSNLEVALNELVTYTSRVCLIVHDTEQFINEKKGNELHCRQHREIVLLIADRHFANRQKAMMGDPDSVPPTPGALALKDAVLNSIVGLLQPGMYVEPVRGEQIILEQKTRQALSGRVAFTLGIRLVGGNVIVPLGRQPIP